MNAAAPLESPEELRAFLGLADTSRKPVAFETDWVERHERYELRRIRYGTADGDVVPALLLRPEAPSGAGLVIFHQHNGQWHLGKSEVAGLVGDGHQALGPPLAAAGIAVLVPDAVGFEDRRRHTHGTEPHADDERQYDLEFSYRLVIGDTLARKVLDDAATAVGVLQGVDEVDPERVGAAGHSFGGHTALFLAAVDQRVRVACVSGAAGSFRARVTRGVGIGLDHVVPGIAARLDFDTLVRCIAPRPLLLLAGENDRYALDASDIAEAARPAYRAADASDRLACEILPGGHALTSQRRELIIRWLTTASHGESP